MLCEPMTYFEALIYGAVQGIAEYLPISSSAHLILLPKFLNQTDPGLTFDVFLHLGTLLATLIYFWREWAAVFNLSPVRKTQLAPVAWKPIVLATLPSLVAGGLLHQWCETTLRGNLILAISLVVGGVALYLSDAYCSKKRTLSSLKLSDAFWIGVAQCFALIPGVSRSGSTMTGGRLLGFDRTESARFSFLISAPVTAAALVFELRHWEQLFSGPIGVGPLLVAGFSSFLFGCLAIGGLLRLLRCFGYLSFLIYRIVLSLIILCVLGL